MSKENEMSLTAKKQAARHQLKQIIGNNDYVYGFFTVNVPARKLEKLPDGGLGYVCVMLKRPPKNSDSNIYQAAFSFCSPADAPKKREMLNKHFKAKSKRIAAQRMVNMRVKSSVDLTLVKNKETKLPDLFRQALDSVKKLSGSNDSLKKMIPSWVEAADKIQYGLYAARVKRHPAHMD